MVVTRVRSAACGLNENWKKWGPSNGYRGLTTTHFIEKARRPGTARISDAAAAAAAATLTRSVSEYLLLLVCMRTLATQQGKTVVIVLFLVTERRTKQTCENSGI